MPWPCVMVEMYPQGRGFFRMADGKVVGYAELPVGAMWLDNGDLVVKLPGNGPEFNIDRGRRLNASRPGYRLAQWTRTGEPPNVTVSPSINDVGTWHGYIRDGMITDDIEGRKL